MWVLPAGGCEPRGLGAEGGLWGKLRHRGVPGAASLAGPLAPKPSKVQSVVLGVFGPACPYPCRPFCLHAFQLSSLPLPSWCQRLILLEHKAALTYSPQHPCPGSPPPPGRGLSVTSAPTVLRGGWETPFHPQFPERRWEGSHPQPGNGGADVRRPHREHLWDTEQPCRALWVCSPASRELGWSQRQRARPKVAAGGLQPPWLLGGRAPFIDFAGRQRYF